MKFEDVLNNRYSVRSYKDKEIEQEKLDKILQAGRIAPTAKNLQPQKIYVLRSDSAKDKLGKFKRMTYNAPVVLMVCADLSKACTLPIEEDYSTYEMDCSIVCCYMMLEAWNLGLGSVWVRWFNSEELRKSFNLEENIKPVCLLPIGYASDDARPREGFHDKRQSLEDEVIYL